MTSQSWSLYIINLPATSFRTLVQYNVIQYNSSAITSTFTNIIMFSFDWHCQSNQNSPNYWCYNLQWCWTGMHYIEGFGRHISINEMGRIMFPIFCCFNPLLHELLDLLKWDETWFLNVKLFKIIGNNQEKKVKKTCKGGFLVYTQGKY